MSVNPASNYPNLAQLSNSALNFTGVGIVENLIQSFLTDPTEIKYTPMVVALDSAVLYIKNIADNSSFRVLLALADGHVAYDSSKGANNTYANYVAGSINENHNTRPEILVAILGNTGVGLSDRFSSTLASSRKYQATRLGATTQTNLGTFRVGFSNTL